MFSKIQKVVSQIQRKFLHRFDDFRFMSGGSATSSFDFGWRKHFSEKFFEWSARGEKTSKSHPNQSKSCEKRQICNQFYKFASLGSAPGTPSWQVQKFVRMGSHILTLCIESDFFFLLEIVWSVYNIFYGLTLYHFVFGGFTPHSSFCFLQIVMTSFWPSKFCAFSVFITCLNQFFRFCCV